jgi:putative permease
MPIEMNGKNSEALTAFSEKATWDFTKGVVITLAVALLLTATSILISQASSVFERSDLTIALHRLGTPETFHTRAQWLENLGPLALVTATGYLIGFGMAQPMANLAEKHGYHTPVTGVVVVITVIVTGFVLAALALLATHPLQKRVLGTQRRRND